MHLKPREHGATGRLKNNAAVLQELGFQVGQYITLRKDKVIARIVDMGNDEVTTEQRKETEQGRKGTKQRKETEERNKQQKEQRETSELYDTARRERAQGVKAIPMDDDIMLAVWEQTLSEVDSGFFEGPISLTDVPDYIPLSKRFGVRQGAKIRCVDDFSRSGINSCSQVSESSKPPAVDIIASLGLSLMRHSPNGTSWKVRTYTCPEHIGSVLCLLDHMISPTSFLQCLITTSP